MLFAWWVRNPLSINDLSYDSPLKTTMVWRYAAVLYAVILYPDRPPPPYLRASTAALGYPACMARRSMPWDRWYHYLYGRPLRQG